MAWGIIAYGGLTVSALVVEALYVFVRQPAWYHHAITGFFLCYFGYATYAAWHRERAWRQQQAYFDQVFHDDPRLHILPLLVGISLLVLASLAGDTLAMTCTTHTYYVDGRYVMCQTCCTNGMCNTMCF